MTKDYGLLILSYVLAFIAAAFTLQYVAGFHVLIQILIADIAATVVIFLFSFLFRNASFYDPYWSLIPIVIGGYLVSIAGEVDGRQIMVCTVVLLWGVRLTGNFLYGWRGLDHEDWRYTNLKAFSGVYWWPLNFVGVHMVPTLVVFLACIPLYAAIVTGSQPLNLYDGLALLLGMASIWLEFFSDVQLHRFRRNRQSSSEVLDQGLWRLCRHPNYLGELGVWLSVFLFGYAAAGEADRWMTIGPVAMFVLFAVVSIPMIETKLIADKPDYAAYKARTFALIPLSFLRH